MTHEDEKKLQLIRSQLTSGAGDCNRQTIEFLVQIFDELRENVGSIYNRCRALEAWCQSLSGWMQMEGERCSCTPETHKVLFDACDLLEGLMCRVDRDFPMPDSMND